MNEIILLLMAVVGVFSIACSVALIALVKIIDQFPLGDEETRTRGITSPVESTRLAVILFWGLFIPGAWAVLQDGIVTIIAGITILFSICLFMFTGLVFSFAVLSTMKSRKNAYGDTVVRVGTRAPAAGTSPLTVAKEAAVSPKPQKNFLSNIMVHALLKK
jgi:hypothetical protein